MRNKQLLSREDFKKQVLKRDNYTCVVCGTISYDLDAHHLLDRKLWDDGGYYLDNGVSLCKDICHLDAETSVYTVEELREKAGILNIIVPSQLNPTTVYDKWGIEIVEDEYDKNWFKKYKNDR